MDRSAYDRWLELDGVHFWRIAKRELVLGLAARHSPPPRPGAALRILDIGGANSLLSRALARLGDLTLVEPDAETVALVRAAAGLDVRVGHLPDALPVAGPFDLITLLDVFEHIDDDRAAARVVRDLLRPGGVLIASVPALPLLWSDHDVANHHFRRYVRRDFRELLLGAGLVIERLTYFTSLLLPLVAAQRLLSRLRRGIPERSEYPVRVPPAPLNRALLGVMGLERALLRRLDLPLGSSLIAVCRRPA